ncbi:AzlD domain-containing protein [Opitutaceae bacterium TAV4]|nr:AzlD domain-containing protein [Opitutaceae bacterium TAV4]RRK00323.1 AzlD domain-containing protein [Opitutaceae bacterium TAV3]
MKILALFLGLGTVTFLMRFSFIGLLGRRELPEGFKVGLYFVPLVVLTAIVVPEVLLTGEGGGSGGWGALQLAHPKVPAALAAVFVAAWTRQVLPTLVTGMGVLWLVRWLMG